MSKTGSKCRAAEKISGIVPAEFESTVTADWLGSKKQDPNFGQENWALYA